MPHVIMTAEEKLQRKRDQDKARSKRLYDRDKVKIAERRKIARDKCHALLKQLGMDDLNLETNNQSVVKIAQEIKEHILEEDALAHPNKTPTQSEPNVEPDSEIGTQVMELVTQSSRSEKFYNDTRKALSLILNCSDWNKCFGHNSKNTIYKIETATQQRDPSKLYSTNSKKGFYQTILKTVGDMKIKMGAKVFGAYSDKFLEYKLRSHLESQEKKKNKVNIDIDEYVQKVLDAYGKDSKQALIIKLYELHPFRDDLVLQIIPKQVKEVDKNYIIVPENKTHNLTLVLNTYKTDKKYGQELIPIPKELSKELRKYIDTNKLKYDDYLFGKKKLTSFIKTFNEKIGLKVTINTLRQMKVNKILNNNPTVPQRLMLAKQMKHTPLTSQLYYQTKTQAQTVSPNPETVTKTKTTKEKKTKTIEV